MSKLILLVALFGACNNWVQVDHEFTENNRMVCYWKCLETGETVVTIGDGSCPYPQR